eukprot:g17076.t1
MSSDLDFLPRPPTGRGRAGPGASRGATGMQEAELQRLEERIRAECGKSRAKAKSSEDGAKAKGGPALTGSFFKDLPISKRTLRGLQAAARYPQRSSRPAFFSRARDLDLGRDIMGEARTGSGKTLAFLIPVLERLYRSRWSNLDGLGAAIVSPTRELAYQIFQVLSNIGQEHELSAGCIQNAVATMSMLVATPGRFLQHLDESPGFEAASLLILVIDEADRILDFGFQETMQNILGQLPGERQTLLFSATLHGSVHRLGRAALRSPEVISVHHDATSRTPDTLKQTYMILPLEKKVDTLFSFLRSHSQKKIIVFVSTCKQLRFFYEAFYKLKPGPAVMELHGRQSLTKRMLVFQQFMDRERAVALFCTDIAARGVDFPAVDWVVQVDCPDGVDSYIHRVGRTARYESAGKSALFLLPSEQSFAQKLSKARVEVRAITAKQNKEAFAESLGLADVPDLGADWEAGDDDEEEEERELTQKDGAKKKIGKWERRQRRIAAAGKVAEDDDPGEEEDDFLKPVAQEAHEAPIAPPSVSGNKKIKLRKDGSAVQAAGKHVFFGKDGTRKTSQLAQLAEELRSEEFGPEGDRASFLEQVARDLATRDSSDAQVSRARIHEKHQKKRRKERSQRGAKIPDEDGGERGERSSPSRSPSPKPKKLKEAPKSKPTEAERPAVQRSSVGDDLGDLEKQALSKLGGLFSQEIMDAFVAQWQVLPKPSARSLHHEVRGLGRENPNLAGLLKTGGALATLYQASRLLSRTALQVRRRPLPIVREKQVVATKRLPLWQLSDEMYMQRQVSPDPSLSWTEVRRAQARMKEQVMAQQYIDFRHIERELGGFRLQPRYHISELRAGMWLEGRVSRSNDKGVMVDVGAYTEQGEWVDGFLHMGQIKDDGGYVPQGKIMDFVHLGEYDLPELFMGKPRPYSVHDIEKGMQVTGIIRRVWDKWALVDIGCDRLARIHAREHPRERNEYGFYNWERVHKYAWTAYPRGAQMEFWVEKVKNSLHIDLVANRPPSTKLADKVAAKRRTGEGIQPMGDPRPERLTREQLRDREKSEAEKATWSPYVAHVDEWLEDAAEPDDETDSWVARRGRDREGRDRGVRAGERLVETGGRHIDETSTKSK